MWEVNAVGDSSFFPCTWGQCAVVAGICGFALLPEVNRDMGDKMGQQAAGHFFCHAVREPVCSFAMLQGQAPIDGNGMILQSSLALLAAAFSFSMSMTYSGAHCLTCELPAE